MGKGRNQGHKAKRDASHVSNARSSWRKAVEISNFAASSVEAMEIEGEVGVSTFLTRTHFEETQEEPQRRHFNRPK